MSRTVFTDSMTPSPLTCTRGARAHTCEREGGQESMKTMQAAAEQCFEHVMAVCTGKHRMPRLRVRGRLVQPLELRRQALGIAQGDACE